MSQENSLLRRLDGQIRAAYAELGKLQLHLVEAHERQLNPAQLGVHIANLGRQIAAWKRERQGLSCNATEMTKPLKEVAPDGGCLNETSSARITVGSRRAASPAKSQSSRIERLTKRAH